MILKKLVPLSIEDEKIQKLISFEIFIVYRKRKRMQK